MAILLAASAGCKHPGKEASKTQPVFRDTYSFYVLDPGPFKVAGPDAPDESQFLILADGEVQLSCGRFQGAYMGSGTPDAELESFARATVEDSSWLPGCNRWLLEGGDRRPRSRPALPSLLLPTCMFLKAKRIWRGILGEGQGR